MRFRVAAMILLTQAAFLWWVADSEIVQSVYLICYSLMMPTALYLVCGGLWRRLFSLTRAEYLFGYIVLTATLPIVGFGGLRFLMTGMGFLSYFAPTQPQWSAYLPPLRSLPVLHDPAAIEAFYKGGPVPWRAWAVPIAFWSLYLLLLSGLWIGLAGVLRRLWVHHERMTFPIAALPLEMTQERADLARRPLFWLGVGIPVVLQSLLTIHDWYPTVPAFQLKVTFFDLSGLPAPWNTVPALPVGWYPMAAGLAYFMPTAVSFSCLAFWVLIRLAYPFGASLGLEPGGTAAARWPYPWEQGAGAWLAMALWILWAARRHLRLVLPELSAAERREISALGLFAVACLLGGAAMMIAAGVAPLLALTAVAAYAAYVLSGARVRAEMGGVWTFAPVTWTPGRLAQELFRTQPQAFTSQAIVGSALFDLVHVDMRAQSLPFLMEGLKIGEESGLRWRTILGAIGGFTLTALALGWWFGLARFHGVGAATAKSNYFALVKAQIGFNEMHALATRPPVFDTAGWMAVFFGGATTALLAALRARFFGFPLHPIGYLLCTTYTMNAFFLPVLLAWGTKTLILRYGGSVRYRQSIAFFVGLTLGDIGIQIVWTIVGRLFDVPIYQFLS